MQGKISNKSDVGGRKYIGPVEEASLDNGKPKNGTIFNITYIGVSLTITFLPTQFPKTWSSGSFMK